MNKLNVINVINKNSKCIIPSPPRLNPIIISPDKNMPKLLLEPLNTDNRKVINIKYRLNINNKRSNMYWDE